MVNLLLLILALAFFAAYFYDRLSGHALTKKLNQNYLARGAHERGQNLVSQELVFTTHASVAQVRQSILSTVKAETDIPLLIADAYIIHSTDTQILYGFGKRFHQSFRGLLTLNPTEDGTKGSWEIIDWTLRDGIVDGQSVMNRFVADINTALRNVDRNAVLRPKGSATSTSSGGSRSYNPPPPPPTMNKSTATNTLAPRQLQPNPA